MEHIIMNLSLSDIIKLRKEAVETGNKHLLDLPLVSLVKVLRGDPEALRDRTSGVAEESQSQPSSSKSAENQTREEAVTEKEISRSLEKVQISSQDEPAAGPSWEAVASPPPTPAPAPTMSTRLDPCSSSLDEIIRERGFPRGRGRGRPLARARTIKQEISDDAEPIAGNSWEDEPIPTLVPIPAPTMSTRLDPCSSSLDEIIQERRISSRGRGRPLVKARRTIQQEVSRDVEPIAGTSRDAVVVPTSTAAPTTFPRLDPLNTSLDELIQERRVSSGKRKAEEEETKTEEQAVEGEEVFDMSPYRALCLLTAKGLVIQMRIGKLPVRGNSHLWQCVITSDEFEVKADSDRKKVAREMASHEFLNQLYDIHDRVVIPEYTVPDELFIDPRIINDVHSVAKLEGLLPITFTLSVKRPDQGQRFKRRRMFYNYVCTLQVGSQTFQGEHGLVEYAKIRAVAQAYIAILGRHPRPTQYFTGSACNDSEMYEFQESEFYQFCDRRDEERVLPIVSDAGEMKILESED